MKNEEIVIATNYKARLLQFAAEGANVVPIYPAEGGITIIFGFVMPKKGPNPDAGKFYCNALLDPDGLAALTQKSFYSPANVKTVLPEAAAEVLRIARRYLDRIQELVQVPLDLISTGADRDQTLALPGRLGNPRNLTAQSQAAETQTA